MSLAERSILHSFLGSPTLQGALPQVAPSPGCNAPGCVPITGGIDVQLLLPPVLQHRVPDGVASGQSMTDVESNHGRVNYGAQGKVC